MLHFYHTWRNATLSNGKASPSLSLHTEQLQPVTTRPELRRRVLPRPMAGLPHRLETCQVFEKLSPLPCQCSGLWLHSVPHLVLMPYFHHCSGTHLQTMVAFKHGTALSSVREKGCVWFIISNGDVSEGCSTFHISAFHNILTSALFFRLSSEEEEGFMLLTQVTLSVLNRTDELYLPRLELHP